MMMLQPRGSGGSEKHLVGLCKHGSSSGVVHTAAAAAAAAEDDDDDASAVRALPTSFVARSIMW